MIKQLIPTALLVLMSCSGESNSNSKKIENIIPPIAFKTEANQNLKGVDEELLQTWSLFSGAVLANDIGLIKKLSTDCIRCGICLENTTKKNSNLNLLNSDNTNVYLPLDKFIQENFQLIFDKNTILRLQDASKVSFYNSDHNKKLYFAACIINPSDTSSTKLQEVFLETVDSTPDREGMSKAFAFIKIRDGYRFCGYETIP